MEKIVYSLLTMATGMLVGLHLAMNGRLGGQMKDIAGSDIKAAGAANGFFWIIGALVASLFFLLLQPGSIRELWQSGSKPLFLAGALGASLVFAVTFLIPAKTGGAGPGFILLVVGQIVMGLLLSHYGWLGSPVDLFSVKKALGVLLLLGGLYLSVS